MKKQLLTKLFALAVIIGIGFTSCKDYDDEINKVANDLSALRTELEGKLQTQQQTFNQSIADLQSQLSNVMTELNNRVTKDALNEALSLYVKLEAFNKYKADNDAAVKALQDLVAKAATKEELENAKTLLEGKINQVKQDLGLKIAALETVLDLQEDGSSKVIDDIKAALKDQLDKINANTELIGKVKEDLLAEIAEVSEELARQTERIDKNAEEIEALQKFLEVEYESLQAMDDALRALIATKVDITTFNEKVAEINAKIDAKVAMLEGKIKDVDDKLDIERLRINTLFDFTRQLKGLTFVPTRGLPAEKSMKLYYFAGDYTSEHVLIYRVTPSNSVYGRDFDIESLNYQITTRSADDGVEDGSPLVDVHINPNGTYTVPGNPEVQTGIKQFGDMLYVPVHIQGKESCDVFGNHDWWSNYHFPGGLNVLSERLFPEHVVKTVEKPEVDYNCTGEDGGATLRGHSKGLSLVITANAVNLEAKEGDPETIRFKSTEHVNTFLVPTQIKLAESRAGQGNQNVEKNLSERLLFTTLEGATAWANETEFDKPNDNKNWNILMWTGNVDYTGGVPTPRPNQIDLYDYVTSFYYPQDGGDLTRSETGNEYTGTDPHRYLYMEFGKEFGEPYFDKPHYAKPVYKFEVVSFFDENNWIIVGEDPDADTHIYTTLEGSILKVKADQMHAARHKKMIIKVTQINSECPERQPVGYLVIKFADTMDWSDAEWTFDFTQDNDPAVDVANKTSYRNIPYYHKLCNTEDPVGQLILPIYVDEEGVQVGVTRDGNLQLLGAPRWMNPINPKNHWGASYAANKNPGDIDGILNQLTQIAGADEFGRAYQLGGQTSEVVYQSFTPAEYNHVNDPENIDAMGVTPVEAFRHVMIRYERPSFEWLGNPPGNNSFVVYVDDTAPAGTYEVKYKLQYKTGGVQAGHDLYLTFKFKVALRKITVTHDTPNWLNENTIRPAHARVHNTVWDGNTSISWFIRPWQGHVVDLKQAFELEQIDGIDYVVTTTEKLEGEDSNNPKANAGAAPFYRMRFEFIPDADIEEAGFTYERDLANYLTIIRHDASNTIAAQINNDINYPDWFYNRLHIAATQGGDELYNYLTQDMKQLYVPPHYLFTKWGKTELMLQDDMERLLPVRMVTDINVTCGLIPGDVDRFANGNYYYVDDFNIKFERALRWIFTPVELTDDQELQRVQFNFATKIATDKDQAKHIYRGVFDHAYAAEDGYGNLVGPDRRVPLISPELQRSDRAIQAYFYNLRTPPTMFIDPWPHYAKYEAGWGEDEIYNGLDYSKGVEVSLDGKTWKPIDNDYRLTSQFQWDHTKRYFDIKFIPQGLGDAYATYEARWQGSHTHLQQPLWFRVPIYNETAERNDYAPDADGNYWMTYRNGYAKIKGYAIFKINKRQ